MKKLNGLFAKVTKLAKDAVRFVVKVIVAPIKFVAGLFVKEVPFDNEASESNEDSQNVPNYIAFDTAAKAKLAKAVRKFIAKHADKTAADFDYSVYANKHGYNLSDIQTVLI